MGKKRTAQKHDDLTKAEREVLAQIVKGRTNPEIATKRYTSRKTVETQVHAILSKLGVSSRTEAAIDAFRKGLIEEDDDLP